MTFVLIVSVFILLVFCLCEKTATELIYCTHGASFVEITPPTVFKVWSYCQLNVKLYRYAPWRCVHLMILPMCSPSFWRVVPYVMCIVRYLEHCILSKYSAGFEIFDLNLWIHFWYESRYADLGRPLSHWLMLVGTCNITTTR